MTIRRRIAIALLIVLVGGRACLHDPGRVTATSRGAAAARAALTTKEPTR